MYLILLYELEMGVAARKGLTPALTFHTVICATPSD